MDHAKILSRLNAACALAKAISASNQLTASQSDVLLRTVLEKALEGESLTGGVE